MGKAMLAGLAGDEVVALVARHFERITDSTITDLGRLRDDLAATRERGYGVDDQESTELMRAVAVALPSTGSLNAVSTPALTLRLPLDQVPEIADLVRSLSEPLLDN